VDGERIKLRANRDHLGLPCLHLRQRLEFEWIKLQPHGLARRLDRKLFLPSRLVGERL
jgi:hypothetical protein